MLASLVNVTHLVQVFGYPLLFLVVMAESSGLPIPGETGLIAAGVLSSQGKLHIEAVIPIAAVAAILGDNIGYQIGRKGGRWLLERPGRFHRQRLQVLSTGEPFFERHGPKAVFFGRFVLGPRVWASWLAGANHMRWRSFFLWNALGGVCWATAVGLVAYFLGSTAGNAIQAFGLYGLAAVLVAIAVFSIAHIRHRRNAATATPADEGSRDEPAPEQPAGDAPAPAGQIPSGGEPKRR